MRALPALASLALVVLSAVPAQAALLTEVTGAGLGTASVSGCSTGVPIAFHLDFNGLGYLAFPQSICAGHLNAFVEDCRHEGGIIVCDGSNPVDATLTLSDDGLFSYEAAYDGEAFRVEGQVAFNQVVLPAFL